MIYLMTRIIDNYIYNIHILCYDDKRMNIK